MNINKKISELMFPNITTTISDMQAIYPKRNLPENAPVTRFAPSPTGYMHIGGLYVSIINQFFAQKNNGVFYLRIEDTDQSRALENGVTEIIETLKNFDIIFDEGPINETEDYGNYGPYRQSIRKNIYQTYAKHMIENDLAYPCFCTKEELDLVRQKQEEENSSILGYACEYATCRHISKETALENLNKGLPFVVRLKSPIQEVRRVKLNDIVRNEIEMDDNLIDIVIIKSDGLPTYHFAHVIDDHLMQTTHVIRADEWLPSMPLHIQMFNMLGFKAPEYAHVCPIMKMEDNSKRKLSKRKDPEARVGYYYEKGYPVNAVKEYLLNLINSRFEEWRLENPETSHKEFDVRLNEMSKSGPLFDDIKLANISKKIIKSMSDSEVYESIVTWSKEHSQTLYEFINNNNQMFKNSINIWHENRMDVSVWSDLLVMFDYLYDTNFLSTLKNMDTEYLINLKHAHEILSDYKNAFDINHDSKQRFESIKQIAEKYNYALRHKDFANNPNNYNGSITDVVTALRLAVLGKKESPDFYQITQLLGKSEVELRINTVLNNIIN